MTISLLVANTNLFGPNFLWPVVHPVEEVSSQFATTDGAGFASRRPEPFIDAVDRQSGQIGDGLGGMTLSKKPQKVPLLSGELVEIWRH